MKGLSALLPAIELPVKIAKKAFVRFKVQQLEIINKSNKSRIVRPGGPVVSLTSYGRRIDTVYLAIESIARGSLLPSEMILWLDDKKCYRSLPHTLKRLEERGLSIRLCENYGPHKKYYPYVDSKPDFVSPLVTADDDIIYPENWLESLTKAFEGDPNVVNGYRARVFRFEGNRIAPYARWELCGSTKPSWRHLLNGVSGVIYPPRFLVSLKSAGTDFEQCCPKADDIWLHAIALRSGFRVRQILSKAVHFPMIPGSQENALYFENMVNGNDVQIASTYIESDFRRLTEQ